MAPDGDATASHAIRHALKLNHSFEDLSKERVFWK
jgi:hypothetical protein